ncbi:DUF3114 domain-containing protein [Periweissella beninensis]|uniref:DUF3114 domain-containing protein n=1 Tax=Periweissella beninensis TaxID=504936 RepID=UPI0021A47027|nr:DUF3114 domain-containing protein [Periweissella beninensis]MCT4395506.1 DUF3114 domain-containing protein [Periweissella beninensis]
MNVNSEQGTSLFVVSNLKILSIKRVGFDMIKQQLDLSQDDWDKRAIKCYLKATKKAPSETLTVGSELYTSMLKAVRRSPLEKLELVLNHLGATIDNNGFLQLVGHYRLTNNLPPHAVFLKLWRHYVQRVFKKAPLNANYPPRLKLLAQKLHLFRSYLDRQITHYVLQNFTGKTDFAKLLAYARFNRLRLDYTTIANYHNRYPKWRGFTYPQNFKIQITKHSRMSEFIINLETGNFVSEWQNYRQDITNLRQVDSNPANYPIELAQPIANTSSFNYGRSKGTNPLNWLLPENTHFRLDISHPDDPKVRKKITNHKNNFAWVAPKNYYFKDKAHVLRGEYADIVKIGPRDFFAWQQIPATDKMQVYQTFVQYCQRRLPLPNPGFAYFLKHAYHKNNYA